MPRCFLAMSVALASWLACGPDREQPDSRVAKAAEQIADGIAEAVETSQETLSPYRCARLREVVDEVEVELGEVAGRRAVQRGDVVEFASNEQDRSLSIGAIADARGTGPATSAAMGRIRAAFQDRGVELVLVLGGMGQTKEELSEHLQLLSVGDLWPIVALPGDREPVEALREAIATVGAGSARVLDGSDVRFISMDGMVVATLPGMAVEERLVAGARGCAHDRQDVDALAERLAAMEGPKVWASYVPPRGSAPTASDVAIGGIHVGEMAQAAAIATTGARLVIHGAVDEAAFGATSGNERLVADAPVVLGAGSVDPLPLTDERGDTLRSLALVVRVEPGRVRWERVRGQ